MVAYIATEKGVDITKIKEPNKLSIFRRKAPLNRSQIIRLCQALGHVNKDKIKEKTKMWDNNMLHSIFL